MCDHACVHASLFVCSQHYCKVGPCVCVCKSVCVFPALLQSGTTRVYMQVCLCVPSITAKWDHVCVRASLSVCSQHYSKVGPRVCTCKSVCVFLALLQSVTMRVCVQVCLCVPSITAKWDHACVRASLSVCSHHYYKVLCAPTKCGSGAAAYIFFIVIIVIMN